MSSILELIRSLPQPSNDDSPLVTDINYIRRSSVLVGDALQKGSDVMQMPNGDIIITEVKTMTYTYAWDRQTSKFERITSGSKHKRKRAPKDKVAANEDDLAQVSLA